MKLCMFHPVGHRLDRGWVGRIDGDRVVHLAAQTLQSFFTGGGTAREHAEYPLAEVRLLAPVLHPPSIRFFESATSFAFANPAAVVGPGSAIPAASSETGPHGHVTVLPRIAGVVGANATVAGFTILADWRRPQRPTPKDRDFAVGLGPTVVTTDAIEPDGLGALVRVAGSLELTGAFVGFDWRAAIALAAEGTVLRPGDLVAGPGLGRVDAVVGNEVEVEIECLGVLGQAVAGA